ncbi:MAG: ATP-dependent Clp protease ATP-binding subunit [Cyanobacteria bacterium P01_D01_bin.123]
MFEYFTNQAIATIAAAQEETRRQGHGSVGTEQLLLGLLAEDSNPAANVLHAAGASLEVVRAKVLEMTGRGANTANEAEIPFTPRTKQVLERALQEARELGQTFITPEHILLSLLRVDNSVAAKVLIDLGVDLAAVHQATLDAVREQAKVVAGGASEAGLKARQGERATSALTSYGTDLTQLAADSKLDPMVGRETELNRAIEILGRRRKNNPILLGEPGVGKTAIAEGLAQRIVNHDVPEMLHDKRVISLDMSLLVAGTRFQGEFEERLTQFIAEVKRAGNIIVVIDEVHTVMGAGTLRGGVDAANLLKPALARGELQCLGATTTDEYRQHIESDAALARRFQPIMVGEPSPDETLDILRGLRDRYEQHHRVIMSDAALDAAVRLSQRFIADRYLPDKAIDLIDEAGSRVRLRYARLSPEQKQLQQELLQVTVDKEAAVSEQDFTKAAQLRQTELALEARLLAARPADESGMAASAKPIVDEEDIAQVVSAWTGVPVSKLSASVSVQLLHLEQELHQRVIGQKEAVAAVARAMRRSRVGLADPNRPIASFLFTGPTGVGKTELTKALAASSFGDESKLIRLDMSEYMDRASASKLIGAPPGFVGYDEGGQLTEAVRRQPYSVILLDEVEKAHPDIFNVLLQVMEDGRLTDAKGRSVSFKNVVLIMTSNLGSRAIEKGGSGFGFEFSGDETEAAYQRSRTVVMDELKQYFRPELLNRLDDIIVFRQLNREEVTQIADVMLQDVAEHLAIAQSVSIEVTPAFKELLVTEGFDPSYGARPLRRAISRLVEDRLSEAFLAGELQAGDTAVLDVDTDGRVSINPARNRVLVEATV